MAIGGYGATLYAAYGPGHPPPPAPRPRGRPGQMQMPNPLGPFSQPRPQAPGPYGPGHPPPAPGGGGGGGTAPNNDPYNYSGDPLLQQTLGIGVKQGAQADATLIEQQRKNLLGFGSAELAAKMFGNDPTFIASVKNNPYSSLATIQHKYGGRSGILNQQGNEDPNNQNLFFSSERLNSILPDLYYQQGGEQYNAEQLFQNAMQQAMQTNLGAHQDITTQNLAAQQDAASRAMAAALASGYGPGAKTTSKKG